MRKKRYPAGVFTDEQARQFATDQCLPSWEEVTRRWNELSGQSIDRKYVMNIAKLAHEKLRRGLQGIQF